MAPRKPRNTIGLILSNVSNDFSGHLMEQAEELFAAQGYQLIVTTTNHSIEREREMLCYFSKITDGILLLSDAVEYKQLADAIPKHIPVIFLNRRPNGCPCTCILEANYSAVYQAMVSNITSGNDRIALICSDRRLSNADEIVSAYQSAMESSPAGFHSEWIHYTSGDANEVPALVETISAQGCNTIFTTTQTLTRHFIEYLLVNNPTTETPLTLIGFSNKDSGNPIHPGFDTVAQPLQELVSLAVQQILYLIQNPGTPAREYLLKGTLRPHLIDVLHRPEKQQTFLK